MSYHTFDCTWAIYSHHTHLVYADNTVATYTTHDDAKSQDLVILCEGQQIDNINLFTPFTMG